MAEFVVLKEQWEWNTQFGKWTATIGKAFSLTAGEYYKIAQGNTWYEPSQAFDITNMIGMNMVAVGDLDILGLAGNGSMFIMGDGGSFNMIMHTSLPQSNPPGDYSFSIEAVDDPGEEPEPEPDPEDGVVLLDYQDESRTYTDVEMVRVPSTTEGEMVRYVREDLIPEPVEKTVELDFSGGGMEVLPDLGKVFSKLLIPVPDGLASENIADGVTVAGIPGSHKGSGKETAELVTRTITNIIIPDGTTSIGDYAFANCTNLKSVTIPGSVKSIGTSAFLNCTNLKSVTIPDSVKSIGNSAFSNSGLTSVTIPGGVSVGAYAFRGPNLTSAVIKPGVVLANNAFRESPKLANVTIEEGVTTISGACFYKCSALTSIAIPASIKNIGNKAFYDTGLTSAVFADTSGWYVSTSSTATSGTPVTVNSASAAATYLRSTYVSHYWFNNS